MTRTIGNPLSWSAQALAGAGGTLGDAADGIGSHQLAQPRVRTLTMDDLRGALNKGWEDFQALRSDVLFLVFLYPIIGLALTVFAFNQGLIPLVFPMAAGFTLLGPIAGLALYEMSRLRERGEPANWGAALGALRSRVIGPVLVLGLILMGIFIFWMFMAQAIWSWTLGPEPPASLMEFLGDVFGTGAGWAMIAVGMAVGFVFAAVVLAISLVSFPMLIDRPVGVPVAVVTSIEVTRKNPVTVGAWGILVAVSLAVASVPVFLGLIVVMPVLGHATWHIYRAAVAPPERKAP